MKVECQLFKLLFSRVHSGEKRVACAATVKGRRTRGGVEVLFSKRTISHKISFVVDNHKMDKKYEGYLKNIVYEG